MRKPKSRDCQHSYLNWETGSIHCHKKNGGLCNTNTCATYKKEKRDANNESK